MKKALSLALMTLIGFSTLSILQINPVMAATDEYYMQGDLTVVWSYATGGSILDIQYVPDVNGDTIADVLAGSDDNNVYLLNGANGSKLWNQITGGDVHSVDSIDDVTGDGIDDVVVGSEDGNVYCYNGANSTEVWHHASICPTVYKVEVAEDITGDGYQEVMVGSAYFSPYDDSGVQCLSGVDGSQEWGYFKDHSYSLTNFDVAATPDVTGDGKWDVFSSEYNRAQCFDGTNGVAHWTKGLDNDWWSSDQRGCIVSIPDISGDDWPDIINLRNDHRYSPYPSRILVLSGPSGEEIWRREWSIVGTDWLRDATHITDITGDGRAEVVALYGDEVYCLMGHNGSTVWSQSLTSYAHSVVSIPDISNDAVDDLIVGTNDYNVYVISGWNGSTLFDRSTGGTVRSVSYIPDVTGDTVPDILAGSDDHFVYCLAPPAPAQPVRLESLEDTGETANFGTITFDGTPYSLPSNVSVATGGVYGAEYTSVAGYVFDHWETTGGVGMSNAEANPTTVTVSSPGGTLRAVYERAWEVMLNASMAGYTDLSVFGVASGATQGFDPAHDAVDPPPGPIGVQSYFWYPDNAPPPPIDYRKLSTSKIASSLIMNWTYRVHSIDLDGTMNISWSAGAIATIPPEYGVYLQCPDGIIIDMWTATSYTFSAVSCTTYNFTVYVGGVLFELELVAGWNMVSLPVIPVDDPSFGNVFSGVGYYQALTWDGTRYVDVSAGNVTAGWGYWVLVLADVNVTVTGMPVMSYERDLPAGWSMIGSIFPCTVNATLVFPGYYQLLIWDGTGYVSSTKIEPGKGYWALVLELTPIVVDETFCTTT